MGFLSKENKFVAWLNGFFKKEYKVPLSTTKYDTEELMNRMGELAAPILSNIDSYPVDHVRFDVQDYNIIQVEDTFEHDINALIEDVISYTNVSARTHSKEQIKEICVLNTLYFLGLDNKIWRFTIKTYLSYISKSDAFDNNFIQICIEFVNDVIQVLDLIKMTKYEKMMIYNIYDAELLKEEKIDEKVYLLKNYQKSYPSWVSMREYHHFDRPIEFDIYADELHELDDD